MKQITNQRDKYGKELPSVQNGEKCNNKNDTTDGNNRM